MTVEWIDPGMSPQPAPLLLPQDLYDEIMALPDGADLSEYFVSHDPAWVIKEIRLSRSEGAEASIACTSRIDLGVAASGWRAARHGAGHGVGRRGLGDRQRLVICPICRNLLVVRRGYKNFAGPRAGP